MANSGQNWLIGKVYLPLSKMLVEKTPALF
jgi:hypothetical protein